jgi:guanosine-3',5'-bis(diphosphate) 3'-pyrophosphohydrolase
MEREKPRQEGARSLEDFIASKPALQKAYDLAEKMHRGQTRAEGEPYFEHLKAVTRILYEEWGIENVNILAAGLLHDSIEDTELSAEEIVFLFGDSGEEIAFLVGGVTQFRSEKNLSKAEADHETLRKVFSNTLIDPKVGVLKLADRLHNMRTLDPMPEKKRVAKSLETLEVYSSLAESLGMWVVKRELENLSLKYADPENYNKFKERLSQDPRNNSHFISYMTSLLEIRLANEQIVADVDYRVASIAALKEKSKTRLFKDIDDVVSFRIVVDGKTKSQSRLLALKTLGAIWNDFGEFDDITRFDNFFYIPRDNGYSAFQVTLNLPEGATKITVTSKEKEDYNNWGVVSLLRKGRVELKDHALKLIFTPTGQVRFFPEGANGYDFAYNIDERMGAQAKEMLVNGVRTDIASVIPNGATVEIIVGDFRMAPDRSAVFHSLPKTRRKIERQFLELEMAEQEKKGKEIVTEIIGQRGLLDLNDLLHISQHLPKVVDLLYRLGAKRSLKRLYQSMGSGVLSPEDFTAEMDRNNITKEKLGFTTVEITGKDEKGILNLVSSKIESLGGNIRWVHGGSGGKDFIIHLVIEGLGKNSEGELKEMLIANQSIEKTILV